MFIYADDCCNLVKLENNIKFSSNNEEVVLYIIRRILKHKKIYYSYLTALNLMITGMLVNNMAEGFISRKNYARCILDVQSRVNYRKAPKLTEHYFKLLLDNYDYVMKCIEYFNRMRIDSEQKLLTLRSKINSYNN